jgi:hypothetical protein
MPTEYIVQSGDNLTKIARAHELRSWRQIYFHPDNVEFRRQRPDPSLIRLGDRLMIPEPSESVPEPEPIPRFLRLPWNFAARYSLPRLLPLAPPSSSSTPSTTGLVAQVIDPTRMVRPQFRQQAMPRRPLSLFGNGRPRPTAPCGPWGCARGPFDLDDPPQGTMGDLGTAVWSIPHVRGLASNVGDYLWTNAPSSRRWGVGIAGGVAVGGVATAFVASDAFRDFSLDLLNDVPIPVGKALLLIPSLDRNRSVRRVLSPISVSLIWQEPESGPPDITQGFQGRGGMLILDFQLGGEEQND